MAYAWMGAIAAMVVLVLAGDGISRLLGLDGGQRIAFAFVAGCVALHLLVSALDLVAVAWSPLTLATPLLLVAVATRGRRGTARERRAAPFGWGDALCLAALLGLVGLSATTWIANPDFVYHWGLKAHRFAIARHVDYAYLARSWNWPIHPDYPNLFPELLATMTLLGGGHFAEAPLLASAAACIGLIALSMRATLRSHEVPRAQSQAVIAGTVLLSSAFAIGHFMAGAADWLIALALVTAASALLRPPAWRADLQLGVCAAFAAATKVEGMALAGCLVAVELARYTARRELPRARALAALLLPPLVVVVHWTLRVHEYHLYQPTNAGRPSLGQLWSLLPVIRESVLSTPAWNGAPFLLLLVPLLLLSRRARALALVVALQLAFYALAYAAAPVDTRFLVLSTVARFVLHVLPAMLLAAAVAWLPTPETGSVADGAAREAAPL